MADGYKIKMDDGTHVRPESRELGALLQSVYAALSAKERAGWARISTS